MTPKQAATALRKLVHDPITPGTTAAKIEAAFEEIINQVERSPAEVSAQTAAEMKRVVEIAEQRNEFVTDVDGFVYWWPRGSTNGHLASHHLRWLADELDRRNAEWNKTIADDFDKRAAVERAQAAAEDHYTHPNY